MTELETVREPAGLVEFSPLPARADTDSWVGVVRDVSHLAQVVAGTEFVPRGLRNSVPATTAAILYGREIGLPPMTSLTQIHIIDGRPSVSAEGMRALVLAAGHELVFDESTGARCRMRARRHRSPNWTALEWNLDQARAAGLLRKDNWRNYPRAMLVARCTGDLCRMVFPDVIHGFRTVEESQDMVDVDQQPTRPAAEKKTTTVRRLRPQDRQLNEEKPAESPPVPKEDAAPPLEPPLPHTRAPRPPLPGAPVLPGDEPPAGEVPVAPPLPTPEPAPAPEPAPESANADALNKVTRSLIFKELTRLGVTASQRPRRLRIISDVVGHTIESVNDLAQPEAVRLLTMLTASKTLDTLREMVQAAAAVEAGDLPEALDGMVAEELPAEPGGEDVPLPIGEEQP